mgnify:FL=1
MNRFIVSAVLPTSMAAGCFYSVWLTAQHTDRLSGLIDMVEQYHTDSDDENALKYAQELKSSWDQILHYSILINDLGHAMEITSCIAEITSFAEEGDDELYAACDRAQAQLELFRQMQTPTLWKIL